MQCQHIEPAVGMMDGVDDPEATAGPGLPLVRRGTADLGLGARLVEVAKERFPAGLQLWAFQSNAGALRFYERHGFTAVEWTDGDNEEGEPDVRMVWRPVPEQ